MKIKLLTLVIVLSAFAKVVAQPQNYNWYFGDSAAVNFSSGVPVAVAGSAMNTIEGSATISDSLGNLLFYSDGVKVWNRNNLQMPNGFGLFGDQSACQVALIIKKPGSNFLYYIFTADKQDSSVPRGICYSVVDMSLNTGLGDVTIKNINLFTPASEKLTAVSNCDAKGVWIIAHGLSNNTFSSYLLTNTGVSSTPVLSNIGIVYGGYDSGAGHLKVSPNGKRLADVNYYRPHAIQIFDFNRTSGVISNVINLDTTGIVYPWDVSFSPDNMKLYVSYREMPIYCYFITQHDLSSNNVAIINASYYYVVPLLTANNCNSMQIGPDNKIYICDATHHYLDVINNPNVLGVGCGLNINAVNLGSGTGVFGLPNFPDAVYSAPHTISLPLDTGVCSLYVSLNAGAGANSYLWSTGDTTQNISVNFSGTYWVQKDLTNLCNSIETDTVHVNFNPSPLTNIGNDTLICSGQQITLQANGGMDYLWNTNDTTSSIIVNQGGVYSVLVSNIFRCTDSDTINIEINNPTVNLGNDTILCQGKQLTITANGGNQYHWNTGAVTPAITVSSAGAYIVNVTNTYGCTASDGIVITYNTNNADLLSSSIITIEEGTSTVITAIDGYNNYLWNTGAQGQNITISTDGTYIVTATDNSGCILRDSITVSTQASEMIIPTIIWQGQPFFIKNLPSNSNLKVYNDIGQIIYQQNNYQNNYFPVIANATYEISLSLSDGREKYGKLVVMK